IFLIEGHQFNGTGQKGLKARRIGLLMLIFFDTVPKLEERDRGNEHLRTGVDRLFETLAHNRRLAVDQRDADIGVEQVGQSKIFRLGVPGWRRAVFFMKSDLKWSSSANHSR